MPRSSQWKSAERELAKAIGGERTGPRGTNTPDVIHPRWNPEVKYGEPKWFKAPLEDALKQAETNARGGKYFVYLREKVTGRRMIVVPYTWFIELIEMENKKYE